MLHKDVLSYVEIYHDDGNYIRTGDVEIRISLDKDVVESNIVEVVSTHNLNLHSLLDDMPRTVNLDNQYRKIGERFGEVVALEERDSLTMWIHIHHLRNKCVHDILNTLKEDLSRSHRQDGYIEICYKGGNTAADESDVLVELPVNIFVELFHLNYLSVE